MGLLDPRFKYVPSTATDIAGTWRRHGFDAPKNAERRARLNQRLVGVAASAEAEASVHPLVRKSA
jgi:hypothetical protein